MSNIQTLYLIYFTLRGYIIFLSVLRANDLIEDQEDLEPKIVQARLIECFITMFLGPLMTFYRVYSFFKKVFKTLTK